MATFWGLSLSTLTGSAMPKPRVLLRETIHWSSTSYGERPSTWICRVIATFWEEAPGSSADIETIVPVPGRPFLRILR